VIGLLGRYACRVVNVSVESFTSSPDSTVVDTWDQATVDRGGWAHGSGPVTAIVPVDGVYLVSLFLEVNASGAAAVAKQAQVSALWEGVLLTLESPEWVHDDGEATQYVAGSTSQVRALSAGTPIEVQLRVGNADPSVENVGIHSISVDLVRIASVGA
jgi:hypothetical protein